MLSLLLLPLTLLVTATLAQNTLSSTCDSFTPSGNDSTYTQPSSRSYTISEGIVCKNSSSKSECSALTGGYVSDPTTYNITVAGGNAINGLWGLIDKATNDALPSTFGLYVSHLLNGSYGAQAGSNGFVDFTPTHRCVAGSLGNCTTQPEFDGVVVEACWPIEVGNQESSKRDYPSFDGTTRFVTTDLETAAALKCNPANTTAPGLAPDNLCQHQNNGSAAGSSGTQGNGAGKVVGNRAWVGVMLMLVMAGFMLL